MNGRTARGLIQGTLRECLDRHGARVALVDGSDTLTYRALGDRIADASRVLREALPGTAPKHVGFCLANSIDYVVLYFATLFAGDLPLLLDVGFNTGEIDSIQRDCGLDALIVNRSRVERMDVAGRNAPVPLGEDVALVALRTDRAPLFRPQATTEVCRFTSGTTGKPKCIEFSGEAVVAAARNWLLGTGMSEHDRVLCLAALSNGLGFNTSLLSTLVAGGELHLMSSAPLTRPVARRIAERGITRLVAFPALYRNFAVPGGPDRAEMASLTHAISAGSPLWPDVREEFRERYGLEICDYYGIAETGPCTFRRDAGDRAGLGEPLPGVEIRIASNADDPDVGEVLVRTASMASRYLNHPDLFASRMDSDGFYHSGDRGRLVDGRLHLVGRTEDHINVAGRKVDPQEIVDLVSTIDGVQEAVAFPEEDRNRETLVHLVIVAPRRALTRADVAELCRSRLAPYKVPGRITFLSEIPRTGIGKPRIALIREQLNATSPREARDTRRDGFSPHVDEQKGTT
jgi:acyl-coenzyme A synthetase/AMP-(fatty) acid ligase